MLDKNIALAIIYGMNAQSLRNDIQAVIRAKGINLHKLAQMAGVSQSSLWLFVNCQREGLSTETLFRLWPHIYVEQSPTLLHLCCEDHEMSNPPAVADKD